MQFSDEIYYVIYLLYYNDNNASLMINQKESKQVRIDSWLLKLLSRYMKTITKMKD